MEKSKNPDDKILSYNDVVLRRSDLDILAGPHFLNDRLIEFFFSHLSSLYPSKEILLLPPSIAFWIKECPDGGTLHDFLKPLDLVGKKLILLPVNDNDDPTLAGGGSHWSLLVFGRRAGGVFVHHDSLGIHNGVHAWRIYRAMGPHVGEPGSIYVERPIEPGQTNGYDCGLYVMAVAEAICEWWAGVGPGGGGGWDEGLWYRMVDEKVTLASVARMRGEILELVRALMAEH